MNVPNDLFYAESHEWARLNDDGTVTVGITDHAQEQLGDLVFVETPEVDAVVSAGDAIAVVESVKAASDIHAPISGTILDCNTALAEEPELVNTEPYSEGWLFTIQPEAATEIEELMDQETYEAFVVSESES